MFRGEEGKEDIEVMEENIWSDLVGEKKLSCVIHVTMLRMSDSVLDLFFLASQFKTSFLTKMGHFLVTYSVFSFD